VSAGLGRIYWRFFFVLDFKSHDDLSRPRAFGNCCSRALRVSLLKNTFASASDALLGLIDVLARQSSRRLMAVVSTLLLLGGGGAYAVATAVVSFAPDAAQLPVREVSESVQPLPLIAQADALDTNHLTLFRSDVTRPNDTADTLLKRMGIDDPAAAAFLRTDPATRQSLMGRSGRLLTAEASEANALLKLSARWSPDADGTFKRLVIEKKNAVFSSRLETAPLATNTRLASGIISSSLFAATDEARVPDTVATQIAEIFSGDIDFHRSLRKGDRFSVVYETLEGDGEPLRAGRVLSAEFVNAGKTFQATWFQEPGLATSQVQARGGYYTLDGQSLRRAFLASPMEFSRVTSGFKMRFHPILQTWRAHLGVDYAAPHGTAVRSVGDGVVDFSGVQNGFGNVVIVKHRNNNSTVYAHLSRIAVKRGQSIGQGQNIGAVGATGWATGPHLHFEFRVNGAHKDPLTIARQSETTPVSPAAKPLFMRFAQAARQQLAIAATLQPGSAQ
jgi:murein DD-endopeptidase MepM/ murein hydrolase activator NlpD